jgi:hypothetical protein
VLCCDIRLPSLWRGTMELFSLTRDTVSAWTDKTETGYSLSTCICMIIGLDKREPCPDDQSPDLMSLLSYEAISRIMVMFTLQCCQQQRKFIKHKIRNAAANTYYKEMDYCLGVCGTTKTVHTELAVPQTEHTINLRYHKETTHWTCGTTKRTNIELVVPQREHTLNLRYHKENTHWTCGTTKRTHTNLP